MKTKKILIILLSAMWFINTAYSQGQAINSSGTGPDGSAMLDVSSTSKGLLIPRMKTSEKMLILPLGADQKGLLVYDKDLFGFYYYTGLIWTQMVGGSCEWTDGGTVIYPGELADNVGIGTSNPLSLLSVGNGSLFQVNTTGTAMGITGSAGSPSFSFVSDPDNGMYSGGADILRFSTAGTDRISIIANGNVGIGTTTPAAFFSVGNGSLFQVNSSGNALGVNGWMGAPAYSFTSDANTGFFYNGTADVIKFSTAGSARLNIIANGNVGLGSSVPAYLLDVYGTIRTGCPGTTGQLRIYDELGGTDYEVIFNPSASQTQNTTYTLPVNDGDAGQMLTTNGSGTLSWAAGSTHKTYVNKCIICVAYPQGSTWTNCALSGYGVADGDIVNIVLENGDPNNEQIMGARSDGSGLSRYFSIHEAEGGAYNSISVLVKAVGATAIIEVYGSDVGGLCGGSCTRVWLAGYWH